MSEADTLKRTVLHDAHVALGARMVPFAGYAMPVQYKEGVLAEHRWTREHAGLFDVSHMGPAFLTLNQRSGDPDRDHADAAAIVEARVCGEIRGMKPGQLRYTLLLNDDGGMLDDLIVGRPSAPELQGTLYIVVNASTKDGDYQLIGKEAGYRATIERLDDNALLALQGPEAAAVLEGVLPGVGELSFMTFRRFTLDGEQFLVSRSGYTGEDGFEILAPAAMARAFWDRLLSDERVRPIGLGARDSLRLEAGLPLYGHDADETVSPVEAGLNFAIAKRRREARDFPGADRILRELGGTLARVRVGLRVLEGAPAREGAEIADETGAVVGRVTSGGPSPTLGGAVAMGFVPPALSAVGTRLKVLVRGRPQAAEVVPTPFTPHRYHRKTAAAS